MVEFYYGDLVEYVRKRSQEQSGREPHDEDELPDPGPWPPDARRASTPPEGPLSFCPEGCYWRCEHR